MADKPVQEVVVETNEQLARSLLDFCTGSLYTMLKDSMIPAGSVAGLAAVDTGVLEVVTIGRDGEILSIRLTLACEIDQAGKGIPET